MAWQSDTVAVPAFSFPMHRAHRRHFFSRPAGWVIILGGIWCLTLLFLRSFPAIDLAVSYAFFRETFCIDRFCGKFPYRSDPSLKFIRQIMCYLPVALGVGLLWQLLDNFQHHGATYCARKTRDYGIAFIALLAGPGFLVNAVLKQISHRSRPYDTNIFGGHGLFMPAGDFGGTCIDNCSFISGEASGAGWIACLLVLVPKNLRPLVAPPIIAISILTAGLRVAFGAHYFSDVVLGWLLSLLVYAVVALSFEMSQWDGKRCPVTLL